MKKLLYCMLAVLFLTACSGNTPTQSTTKGDYVDLGLSSGTKWKTQNEQNPNDAEYAFYDYDAAVSAFGNNLPSREQWMELVHECSWNWTGMGYIVNGPSGESITLPASGDRSCDGGVYRVGTRGDYWSSAPCGSEDAWGLYFRSDGKGMYPSSRCHGRSVRLVR